jgi:hypothetical protein
MASRVAATWCRCLRSCWLCVIFFSPGCGGGPTTPPPDAGGRPPGGCESYINNEWVISGPRADQLENPNGPPPVVLRLELGQSQKWFVSNFGAEATNCLGVVTSTHWKTNPSGVVNLLPLERSNGYDRAWLTASGPGETVVTAILTFVNGSQKEVRPTAYPPPLGIFTPVGVDLVRVAPVTATPPGTQVVVAGSFKLDPYTGGVPAGSRTLISFSTRVSGRLEVTVDWASVLNSISFLVYAGLNAQGTVVVDPKVDYTMKPVVGIVDNLPPGDYTLMIDNAGPGPETGTYIVRLRPA